MKDLSYEFTKDKLLTFHRGKIQRWLDGEDVYPINISVDLTTACNFKCQWCCDTAYRSSFRTGGEQYIDSEILIESLTQDIINTHSVTLVGGGEPTLHPKFSRIVRNLYSSGIQCGVITNGSMLSTIPLDVIKKLRFIRVSLDAGDRETFKYSHGVDMWDRVIDGLDRLSKERSSENVVGVTYLLDDNTKKSVSLAVEIIRQMGLDYVQIKPVLYEGGYKEVQIGDHLMQYFDSVSSKDFRVLRSAWDGNRPIDSTGEFCFAHRFVGVILPTGDVSFCCRLKGNKQYNIGNIYQDMFGDIWKSRRRHNLIKIIEKDETFVKRVCGDCMLWAINSTCNQLHREMQEKGNPVLWRFV